MSGVKRFAGWVWPYFVLAMVCAAALLVWSDAAWSDHDGCYDDCGYESEENWGYDNRRGRDERRAGISPGPFDRSPVDFRDNCISLDCSGRDPSEGRR